MLPFLYAAASDHFGGRGTVQMTMNICRAILSIVVHSEQDKLEKNLNFSRFLVEWEISMQSATSDLARLLPSDRFAVEHDIHCCRVKAAELGDAYIAEELCARLEKSLHDSSRESGYASR